MKLFVRSSRHTVSSPRKPIKLQIDHLEDRLVPSGFGPADGAYISEPWNGLYNEVQIQPTDQKIVAAGASGGMAIARYDAQGNTDATYGNGGVTTSSLGGGAKQFGGTGLALQSDGSAIVSGVWYGGFPTQHFVARIKTNGLFDTTYGTGGWTHAVFNPNDNAAQFTAAVALQSTGKAVMASLSGSAVVARFTTSGSLDTGHNGFGTLVHNQAIGYTLSSFGGSGGIGFFDVAIQQDDKVVAVGSPPSNLSGFLVARYTANGALDTTFNGTGYTTLLPAGSAHAGVLGVTLQSDGKIVTVGQSDTAAGTFDLLVSRFNTNGTLDTSFGAGAGYVKLDVNGPATPTNERGRDVVIQSDGKIVVVGNEDLVTGGVDGPASVTVARLNPDGSLDSTFGNGGFKVSAPPAGHNFYSTFQGLAPESNGNIIVAGVDNDGTNGHPMLMRFFSTTTSPLGPVGNPGSPSNGGGLRFTDLAGTGAPGLIGTGNNTPSQGAKPAQEPQHAQPKYRQSMAPADSGIQAKSLNLAVHHTAAQTADAAFLSLFPRSRLHTSLGVN